MTVLTAFIVSLVVGMLASDSALMRSFWGTDEAPVARNDVFYVPNGKPGKLDVLANDTGVSDTPQLRLLRGPDCGLASVMPDAISYVPDAACTGVQQMMYCIAHDTTCVRAGISVTVLDAEPTVIRTPTVMVTSADIVLKGPDIDQDAPITGMVVELAEHADGDASKENDIRAITELFRPGAARSDATADVSLPHVPVAEIALDPKEASSFLRSYAAESETSDPAASYNSDTFDARAIQRAPDPVGRIATAAFVPAKDAPLQRGIPQPGVKGGRVEAIVDLPPLVAELEKQAAAEANGTAALVAEVAPEPGPKPIAPLRHRPKHPPAAFVAGPGAACETNGKLAIRPGEHLRMSLSAPCLAGELVTFRHGGMSFVHKVSNEGDILISIPALPHALDVTLTHAGTEVGRFPIKGRLGSEVARVIVSVPGGSVLVDAIERDRDGQSPVSISTERIIPHREAAAGDRGYLRRYLGEGGDRIFSYTLPLTETGAARSVELRLIGKQATSMCGQSVDVSVLGFGRRQAEVRSVTMPACDAEQIATIETLDVGPTAQLR